jgi:hypothetical protein
MASAAQTLHIKNHILSRARALGNTKRGFKEVCSDLVNQHGVKGADLRRICDGTFLCPTTIQRIATLEDCETGIPYRPNADTVERILRYFGAEVTFDQVSISNRYQNKPKMEE